MSLYEVYWEIMSILCPIMNVFNSEISLIDQLLHNFEISFGQTVSRQFFDSFVLQTTDIIEKLNLYHDEIVNKVDQWKRNQQLSMNGLPFDNNLDQLQDDLQEYTRVLMKLRRQIKRSLGLCQNLPFDLGHLEQSINQTKQKTDSFLKDILKRSLIVEKQPPQVLKDYKHFEVKVRLLVHEPLCLELNPPIVEVRLINEIQALEVSTNHRVLSDGSVLLSSGIMDYNGQNDNLSLTLTGLKLRHFERIRRVNKNVDKDKCALLFQTQFKLPDQEEIMDVWAMSLPIVVILNTSQEPIALATIFWDNQFCQSGRLPFHVVNEVTVEQMARMLGTLFAHHTGKTLTEEQCNYLASKLAETADVPTQMVSWETFARHALPNRKFTFWKWFHAIIKMYKKYLRQIWDDGSIMAFIPRQRCLDLLSDRPIGTFIIKVSEYQLSAVTVVWAGEEHHGCRVYSLEPYTTKHMDIIGLVDLIRDTDSLTTLYPDIPKDLAFCEYYKPMKETSANESPDHIYVEFELRFVLRQPRYNPYNMDSIMDQVNDINE